jgi:hypothetical protein
MNVPTAESRTDRVRPGHQLLLPGQLPSGEPILSVLCKRSFSICPGPECPRAEKDTAIVPGDVPWDTPLTSSVRFESDYVPYKVATDVVLNGFVYSPGGVPCQETSASLAVGSVVKTIAVIGDREAQFNAGKSPGFRDPQPFKQMPLCYERAYGGTDVYSDPCTLFAYPRNPLGRGFVVANAKAALSKLQLPNIEDPDDRISPERLCVGDFYKGWQNQPMPTSLGWFPKTWLPRAALAGVMPGDRKLEQELRKNYEQLIPPEHKESYKKTQLPDMNFRFFSGASAGLAMPYLQGGEQIVLHNLTPEGRTSLVLPQQRPKIIIDIGEGPREPEVELQTVMIHAEERLVDMVWRGAISYPGMDWLPTMTKLEIAIL